MSRVHSSLPAKSNAFRIAGAGHDPHVPAVGDRRRRRHVLLAADPVAARERTLPGDGLRVPVDRPQLDLTRGALGGHVQEHGVVPDDRCRSAVGRQRQLPGDVLGRAPRGRKARFRADAVHRRTAPVRPAVRHERGANDGEKDEREDGSAHTTVYRHSRVPQGSTGFLRVPQGSVPQGSTGFRVPRGSGFHGVQGSTGFRVPRGSGFHGVQVPRGSGFHGVPEPDPDLAEPCRTQWN